MKYKTVDVLVGMEELDRQGKAKITDDIVKVQDAINKVIVDGHEETQKIGYMAAGLMDRIANGETVTRDDMSRMFKREGNRGWRNNEHLGQDGQELERLTKELNKLEGSLAEWRPSEFTRFLRTLSDEFVTDHGVDKAGYGGYSLGRVVMSGRP